MAHLRKSSLPASKRRKKSNSLFRQRRFLLSPNTKAVLRSAAQAVRDLADNMDSEQQHRVATVAATLERTADGETMEPLAEHNAVRAAWNLLFGNYAGGPH